MIFRRRVRTFPVVTVCVGLMTLAGLVSAQAATASTAAPCPPDWLGTTQSTTPQISADGRYVVFRENSPDGEAGDSAILLRDRELGTTVAVSAPDGTTDNLLPSISADGTRVSWIARDTDFSTNQGTMWVYDRVSGARTAEGVANIQDAPQLDAHGRHLVYGLLQEGTTQTRSIYVRDLDADTDALVSADIEGGPANALAADPQISNSGRYVLFSSAATDLTEDAADLNTTPALFVRDLRTGTTTLIPDRTGEPASVYRFSARLSPDGRYVLYQEPGSAWRYDRRTGKTVAASDGDVATGGDIGFRGRKVLVRNDSGSLVVRTVATGVEVAVADYPDGSAGDGYPGAITPRARQAVFYSTLTDLDPQRSAVGDVNVYVRDLGTGTTELISTTDAGGSC